MSDEAPKKKRKPGQPSMKEQIIARRRAEEAQRRGESAPAPAEKKPAPVPSKPQAAKPAPQPAAPPVAKPAAKAPAKPAAKAPVKPAAKAAPAKAPVKPVAKAAGAKPAAKSGGVQRSRPGASKRSGSRRSGSSEGGGRRRAGSGGKEKKSPIPLVLAGVALIAVLGVLWYMFGSGDGDGGDVQAGETTSEEVANNDAATESSEGGDGASEPEQPSDSEGGAEAAAAEDDEDGDEGEEPEDPAKVSDPSELDLMAEIPEFGRARGTSDEEWAELQTAMVDFANPDSGIKGSRAGNLLEEMGRKSFPVVLNHMRTLDYATEQGRQDGDVCQRLLEKICNGSNFGWRYSTEPSDVLYNKKVVRRWAQEWQKAEENLLHWKALAKLKDAEFEALEAELGDTSASELEDELDDLDDF